MEVEGWGVGGFLDCEFEVACFSVAILGRGEMGRRGYGETACFGEGGDVGVEPLAGEEL